MKILKRLKTITAIILAAGITAGCSGEGEAETSGAVSENTPLVSDITTSIMTNSENAGIVTAPNAENIEGELISIYPYADVNPDYKAVSIDGFSANGSYSYKGIGITVDEYSARLLTDYKDDDESAYSQMVEYLFDKKSGAAIPHIRILFGFDGINQPDVFSNAAFMFAADAKEINPDITLELSVSGKNFPNDDYEKLYECYKNVMDKALDAFGLTFGYISFPDGYGGILPYLNNNIKSENDTIKIAVPESMASELLENQELMNAADIIRVSKGTSPVKEVLELNKLYDKELWYADGAAPADTAWLAANIKGFGLSGAGGALDICNRIINSICNGKMTMYEYGYPIAANYMGAGEFPKSLLTAQTPWNGLYTLNAGYWTTAHFSGFINSGWRIIDSASMGDGKEENKKVTDTKNNLVTLVDPATGDYSIIISNDSNIKRGYTFTVTNMQKADKLLHVWESIGYDESGLELDSYNQNYFKISDEFYPVEMLPEDDADTFLEIEAAEGENNKENEIIYPYAFSVTVKPYSVVTVTTLDKAKNMPDARYIEQSYTASIDDNYAETLPLTWVDEYDEYSDDFLKTRGGVPKYAAVLSGVFAVETVGEGDNKALLQKAKPSADDLVSQIVMGDDRWANYTGSTDFMFDKNGAASKNFVQFGVRNIKADGESGYAFRLYQSGNWEFRKNSEVLKNGTVTAFDISVWHNIKITADSDTFTVFLDDRELVKFTDVSEIINSGRISIISARFDNAFDNVKAEEIENEESINPYIVRVDDMDVQLSYEGRRGSIISEEFERFETTATEFETGASVGMWFYGTEIAFVGKAENAVIKVLIDGEESEIKADSKDINAAAFRISGLNQETHEISVELVSGSFTLNMIEYR